MKVLVVDDNPSICALCALELRKAGHRVTEAKDGLEAFEILMGRKGHFNVVVTDCDMPRIDGIQLITAIKKWGIEVPVIMASARPEVHDEAQETGGPVVGFFSKAAGFASQIASCISKLAPSVPVLAAETT